MTTVRQEPVTIPFGGGPDESVARLFREATVLETVLDGDTSKAGGLRKARGYERISLAATTHEETPEAVYISVGVDRDELVLVGLEDTYALAASDAIVDGAAVVRRGPSMVGNFRSGLIHVAAIGEE